MFYSITFEHIQLGFLLYLLALATDLLDGYIARITKTASASGAFLDVCADFLLAFSGVMGCMITGRLSVLVPVVSLFMFAQFITGYGGKVVYDPFGKRFGVFVLLCTPLDLYFPGACYFINSFVLLFGLGSLIGRRIYLSDRFVAGYGIRLTLYSLNLSGLNIR